MLSLVPDNTVSQYTTWEHRISNSLLWCHKMYFSSYSPVGTVWCSKFPFYLNETTERKDEVSTQSRKNMMDWNYMFLFYLFIFGRYLYYTSLIVVRQNIRLQIVFTCSWAVLQEQSVSCITWYVTWYACVLKYESRLPRISCASLALN